MKIVKKNLGKKAFTLVELLAAIVILGVLVLIAVPEVSKYISYSKKQVYKSSLAAFAKYAQLQEFEDYNDSQVVYYDGLNDQIKNNLSSPYGEIVKDKTFLVKICANDKCNMYIQVIDSKGYGIPFTNVNDVKNIDSDDIKVVPTNNIVTSSVQLGDANTNGEIEIMDASNIQMFLEGTYQLSSVQQFFADVNANGKVDACDAKAIQEKMAHCNYTFPIKQGDVNKDGVINQTDLTSLQNSVGSTTGCKALYDLNCDNNINSTDVDILSNYLAGRIGLLPVVD